VKRLLTLTAAAAGAAAVLTLVLLPPKTMAVPPPAWKHQWPHVRGAYHVHSQRSDGTGTIDDIAAAAAAAGLQFVILTDHGNGTRAPEPPSYRSGVLCIDAVEISTAQGHYVALGLPQTPYALAGDVRDVIADVRYFGGFGVAAHPGSRKAELAWTEWGEAFDGIEWLNADSEWRDESTGSLLAALLTYPFRTVETIAGILDRPAPVLQRWDEVNSSRRVPALAAADAHARLALGQSRDPYEDGFALKTPAYETSFAAFANRVILDRPLTGDAAIDAALVLAAVREGRAYTFIDGLASGGAFDMAASSAGGTVARIGEYLDPAGHVIVDARLSAPSGTTMVLLRDGVVVDETTEETLQVDVGALAGAYRVEARLPGASADSVPWLLTNPIYIGMQPRHEAAATPPSPAAATARTGIATASWRAESASESTSTLAAGAMPDGTPALEWRFRLSGGPRPQFAAVRFPVDESVRGHTRLQLRAQSDQPRRLSVQLRGPANERWVASVFLDSTLRSYDLSFADFRPTVDDQPRQAPLDRIDSLLLVIDPVNTLPGSAGTIWIPDLWLAR
jgi:hypothetical protein